MNTKVSAIYKETVQRLTEIYGESEAQSVANILFEDLLRVSKILRLTNTDLSLSEEQMKQYEPALSRLLSHEPIQHILGYTYFYGRKFQVNQHTLVPRPETEELVELIIRENSKPGQKVLDIGTGSGCIGISLALGLKDAEVTSWDISAEALKMANENAQALGANVSFNLVDVLNYAGEETFDIIVSNPPYIPDQEKVSMHENVLHYEPEMALFVPDDDPLLFYRRIGELGQKNLTEGGKLYFEIHENYGADVKSLLESLGYEEVAVFKDMQGKERMVRAFV